VAAGTDLGVSQVFDGGNQQRIRLGALGGKIDGVMRSVVGERRG